MVIPLLANQDLTPMLCMGRFSEKTSSIVLQISP